VKIVKIHSHQNGWEFIKVWHPRLWKEIEDAVASVDATKCRTKISKEKTKMGKALYAPKVMNKLMEKEFGARGWKEKRTSYWVTEDAKLIDKTIKMTADEQRREIVAAGLRPIFSYNQTDFVKDRIAVEIQFGKYSFVAYDLFVKHMAFYIGNIIDVGVEILAMKSLQELMSSGPGYFEGELYNLIREGRGVPAVPLVLVGVVP
jgi:hypothetical protein